jgi:hypothetical protein
MLTGIGSAGPAGLAQMRNRIRSAGPSGLDRTSQGIGSNGRIAINPGALGTGSAAALFGPFPTAAQDPQSDPGRLLHSSSKRLAASARATATGPGHRTLHSVADGLNRNRTRPSPGRLNRRSGMGRLRYAG